jgi:selenide,water dikinase
MESSASDRYVLSSFTSLSGDPPLADPVRLTQSAKAAGCAAKMSPGLLDSVLRRLPRQNDPKLLVGFETSDDAGVYQISDDLALVQTVDFFTPIADDPYTYGQIAAANSLSDVYAMGGRPICSLSVLAYPAAGDLDVLEQILRGGLDKMTEAGCTVAGGHSIRDDEPKFGYAVTGLIHPRRVWRNVGARPGDVLILSKPLGTGVISTAVKQSKAQPEWVAAAIDSMKRLNRDAAEALHELENVEGSTGGSGGASSVESPIHAVTDVTGFGLLGHAREMAVGSGVSFRIDHKKIAYLTGAIDAARGGFLSGGLANNRQFVEGCAVSGPSVPEEFRALLLDPQTSGGLLASVAPGSASAAIAAFEKRGISARIIGEVIAKRPPLIEVA